MTGFVDSLFLAVAIYVVMYFIWLVFSVVVMYLVFKWMMSKEE